MMKSFKAKIYKKGINDAVDVPTGVMDGMIADKVT